MDLQETFVAILTGLHFDDSRQGKFKLFFPVSIFFVFANSFASMIVERASNSDAEVRGFRENATDGSESSEARAWTRQTELSKSKPTRKLLPKEQSSLVPIFELFSET